VPLIANAASLYPDKQEKETYRCHTILGNYCCDNISVLLYRKCTDVLKKEKRKLYCLEMSLR